jgi:hypothetical protein
MRMGRGGRGRFQEVYKVEIKKESSLQATTQVGNLTNTNANTTITIAKNLKPKLSPSQVLRVGGYERDINVFGCSAM